jgi:hypothetical protein
MNIIDQINRPAPKQFRMLALQGEEMDNQSTEILVELRDGKIYECDDFGREIKVAGESSINGWGEALNGPAYVVGPVSGPGKTYVPKREWDRILAGKHSRA